MVQYKKRYEIAKTSSLRLCVCISVVLYDNMNLRTWYLTRLDHVCLSICLSVCLSVCHLSVYQSVVCLDCQSVCLSVCRLSVCVITWYIISFFFRRSKSKNRNPPHQDYSPRHMMPNSLAYSVPSSTTYPQNLGDSRSSLPSGETNDNSQRS